MAAKKTAQKEQEASEVKSETGKVTQSKVKQSPAERCREAIVEAQTRVDSGYMDLSKLLHEAYYKEYHVEWGYDDFRGYCDSELGTDYRKAMYLVDIWDKVKKLNLPVKDVEKIGWSKMKEVAAVIDEKNAKEWLAKAKEMSARDLQEAVRIVRQSDSPSGGGGSVPKITTMTLKMSEAEANIILDAIEEAKKLTENESPVVALGMICQDWSESQGQAPKRASLEDHVKFLERTYGIKISFEAKGQKTDTEAKEVLEEAEARVKSGNATAEDEDDIDSLLGGDDGDARADTDDDINDALGL